MRGSWICLLVLGFLTVAAGPVAVARTAHHAVVVAPTADVTDAVTDAAPLAVATVQVLAPLGDLLRPGPLPNESDMNQAANATRQAL
jgi:hypothetical protein